MIVYCASYIKTQGARVLIGQSRTAGNTSITGSTSTGISWEPILMKAKMSIPCGILTTKESQPYKKARYLRMELLLAAAPDNSTGYRN